MLVCQAVPSPTQTKATRTAWTGDHVRRARAIQLLARVTAVHERALARDVARILRLVARTAAAAAGRGAYAEAEASANSEDARFERALVARGLVVAGELGRLTLRLLDEAERKDAGPIAVATQATAVHLRRRAGERVVRISAETRRLIRQAITEGVDAGDGALGIAQRIMARVGDLDEAGGLAGFARAERIARTENHFAASLGAHEAARATGLDLDKEWGSVEDDRVRPSHAEADGQTVAFDAPFLVGEAELDYPGDPDGPAKEVIGCRCVALYLPRIPGVQRPPPTPRPVPSAPPPEPAARPRPQPPVEIPPAALPTDRRLTPAEVERIVDALERELIPPVPTGATWSVEDERTIGREMTSADRAARRAVVEWGIATETEHLVAIDRDGKSIVSAVSSSARSYVSIPPAVSAAIDDARRAIVVHHNHPSSSSFSPADLAQVASRPGLTELWAHGHDGTAYRARPIAIGGDAVHAAHVRAITAAKAAALRSGVPLTAYEFNALVTHAAVLALADLKIVDYAVFAPQLKRDLYRREQALLADMTKSARGAIAARKAAELVDVGRSGYLIDLPSPADPDEDWLRARAEVGALPANDPGVKSARGAIDAELRRRGIS